MCYLCAAPIYVGDAIQEWQVETTPVAAHKQCAERNKETAKPEYKTCDKCGAEWLGEIITCPFCRGGER